MNVTRKPALHWGRATGIALAIALPTGARTEAAPGGGSFFSNSGFETAADAADTWRLDRGGRTEAEFSVDRHEAGEGRRCARVRLGRIDDWGAQFGQTIAAGRKGATYTFAILAQTMQKPVTLRLQIEHGAKPYDRAARGGPFTVVPGKWSELHVTFTVEKDSPHGWFAYVSCSQSNCEFRADAFRLYEGAYVPFKEPDLSDDTATGVHLAQTGDDSVCVSNALVMLRVRRGAGGVETRVRLGGSTIPGPRLVPAAGEGHAAPSITAFRVVESRADRAVVEVRAAGASGRNLAMRVLLRRNSPVIEVQPDEGMDRLRVETRGRYAVVPDIFAGDLVVDAASYPSNRLRLPGENVAAVLADGGDVMVVCAWRSDRQAAQLALDGAAGNRSVVAMEIGGRRNLPISVGVLAAPGIWQQKSIAELDAVKDVKLDRPVPFRALWRADFRREDGMIDSWKLVIRRTDNTWEGFGVGFTKPKTRTVWTSARGTFAYPACLDGANAFLRRSRFEGPPGLAYRSTDVALVYPFRVVDGSPAEARGVFDVLQEALTGSPEEKRLDGWTIRRVPRDRHPATCAVTEEVESIFDAGEEKAKTKHLLERLEAMDGFVIEIRSRIDEYLAWRNAAVAFTAGARAGRPELAPLAEEFSGVLARFDRRYAELKLGEHTPAAGQALIAQVKALIGSHAPDRVDRIKKIGRDTRTLGGSQDRAIGDFRMLAKELRQRAGHRMLTAEDEAAFEFARAMRERTLEVLGCAFGHEGASTD